MQALANFVAMGIDFDLSESLYEKKRSRKSENKYPENTEITATKLVKDIFGNTDLTEVILNF